MSVGQQDTRLVARGKIEHRTISRRTIDRKRQDLGSFVQDFLKPIAQRIADSLGPVKPVVDAFYTRVDGLDLLLDDPTLKGVIDTIIEVNNSTPGARKIKPINWAGVNTPSSDFSIEMRKSRIV